MRIAALKQYFMKEFKIFRYTLDQKNATEHDKELADVMDFSFNWPLAEAFFKAYVGRALAF